MFWDFRIITLIFPIKKTLKKKRPDNDNLSRKRPKITETPPRRMKGQKQQKITEIPPHRKQGQKQTKITEITGASKLTKKQVEEPVQESEFEDEAEEETEDTTEQATEEESEEELEESEEESERRKTSIVDALKKRNKELKTKLKAVQPKKESKSYPMNTKSDTITIKDTKDKKDSFVTRSRTQTLVEIIKKIKKNDDQRMDIIEIGFGGLLDLEVTVIPQGLLPCLLDAFDHTSYLVKATPTKEFVLTKDDVYDIFMLPSNGREVELITTGHCKATQDDYLKEEWRKRFGIGGTTQSIKLSKVSKWLMDNDKGGDEFKRMFVLYSMSCFLAPTSNYLLDFKLVKAVENVTEIKEYNWSKYVFDQLLLAVGSFKAGAKFLCGCLLVLMLAYMQRIEFRGEVQKTDLPLIKHWSDDKLLKRVKAELEVGSLGQGPLSRNEYPICVKSRSTPTNQVCQEETESGKEYVKLELLPGIESDSTLKEKATNAVHLIFLKVKRNHELQLQTTLELEKEFKALTTPTDASGSDDISKKKPFVCPTPSLAALSPTPSLFNDTFFNMYFEEVVRRSVAAKDAAADLPSFDLLGEFMTQMEERLNTKKPTNNDDVSQTMVTEDAQNTTGLGDIAKTIVSEVIEDLSKGKEVANKEDAQDTAGMDLWTDVSDEDVDNSLEENGRDENDNIEDNDGNIDKIESEEGRVVDLYPYLLHSPTHLKCMDVVKSDLGCSLNCGEPDKKCILVSNDMIDNKKCMEPVLKLRKQLIDYCWLDDHNVKLGERFATYNRVTHFLTKDDALSLRPNYLITSLVIECWSIMLNELIYRHVAIDMPSRIYFGLTQKDPLHKIVEGPKENMEANIDELFNSWTEWIKCCKHPIELDSQMVFIPLLKNAHYFCVCINFDLKMVQYLDNRVYDDVFDENEYVQMAKYAANLMGSYMVEKGVSKGNEVQNYPMENVKFTWQSDEKNVDCGVFTMLHMMFFLGSLFDCDLGSYESRIMYRGEILATLILSDMCNRTERVAVIIRLSQFEKRKEWLLAHLTAKRKRKAKEEEKKAVASKKKPTKKSALKKVEENADISTPTINNADKAVSSPKSILGGRMNITNVISDGMGCTLDCGKADEGTFVISRFMRQNQKLLSKMLKLRREVVDYAFLDDHNLDPKETLSVYRSLRSLDRDDIKSLLPSFHVTKWAVECWSLLLNQIEYADQNNPPLMFFGIQHMDAIHGLITEEQFDSQYDNKRDALHACWNEYIQDNVIQCNFNADLIFIPLLIEQHYSCVCINYRSRRIEVLDNQKHANFEESTLYNAVLMVVSCMSDFVEWKGSSRSKDMLEFEIEEVNFKWKSPEPNNEESGCFLMMHMNCYDGVPFESDLGSKLSRRTFSAEIAASLLLADINDIRSDMIEKVQKFSSKKTSIWNYLKSKRDALEGKATTKPVLTGTTEDKKKSPVKPLSEAPVLRLKINKSTRSVKKV